MSVVKFSKKYLKDPLFWLFIMLVLGSSLLLNTVGTNSLNAQTQVSGEGTTGYLAKWVVSNSYQCTGTRPAGTIMCPNDSTGLVSDLAWLDIGNSSSNCSARKCEYYQPVVYQCTGTRPAGTIMCPNDSTGLVSDLAWLDIGNSSSNCSARKCEYYIPCVPTTWAPPADTVCIGSDFTQTSNCETTRVINGMKDCPTCTATFTPANITSPGSSTLTWSSQNADDIKYSCTGPIPGGADYGVIPLNSPVSPAVVFYFPYGPAATESCIFTVKDDDGEEGTCMTNSSAGGGGGGGCTVNCGGEITPHAPECTLESEDDLVFVGEDTTLTWTSSYADSASINRGIGSITPVASSSIVVFPVVLVTSDITYTGTFTGYGGSTTCSTDSITVVADPPKILDGSFEVFNQKTGLKPKAKWGTNNVVSCDLESDTGYSQTGVCSSKASCASVSDFSINKTIMEETTYTLTCYNLGGYPDIATFTPLEYFVLTAEPTEVEVDFAGGGATTEPGINTGIISWNGYRENVSFTANLSELPESPGDETTNTATFSPATLSFSEYFTNSIKSVLRVFASYRFTGGRNITIWGNGTESVNITITSDQTIPVWDPI